MRLTFPILTLSRGGAQRMLAELSNRLTELGHTVTIIMPINGIVEYRMNCGVFYATEELLTESDFPYSDVIVSNYYTTVPVSQKASEEGKGVHVRLALCYEPAFLPDNNRSFASYNIAPHLLVLSRWQREVVRLHHGMESRIVPIGVNPDFRNLDFRGTQGRKLVISAILRRPEGGFSGHREQDYLLEQLNLVKQLHPEVELYFIIPPGEFAESAALQSLLLDERYHILTPANDTELCHHYNESDIFVSSSTYDSGSLPGLEAMRCGAALVTVYSGGNMEYSVHGQNCLMSYRYENRLADDIITLVRDRRLRLRIACRGELDSKRFTWERSATIFQDEIYDILSKEK